MSGACAVSPREEANKSSEPLPVEKTTNRFDEFDQIDERQDATADRLDEPSETDGVTR